MLFENKPLLSEKRKTHFIELIGKEGCGSKRLALDFAEPKQKAVWICQEWKLYAPLLWSIAAQKQISLMGVEYHDQKRLRRLWKELFESQVFQVWILDHLKLKTADLFFLHHLTRHQSLKILILEDYPHSFCQERIHLSLHHHSYKLEWSKGGPTNSGRKPQYKTAEYLSFIRSQSCLP